MSHDTNASVVSGRMSVLLPAMSGPEGSIRCDRLLCRDCVPSCLQQVQELCLR